MECDLALMNHAQFFKHSTRSRVVCLDDRLNEWHFEARESVCHYELRSLGGKALSASVGMQAKAELCHRWTLDRFQAKPAIAYQALVALLYQGKLGKAVSLVEVNQGLKLVPCSSRAQ